MTLVRLRGMLWRRVNQATLDTLLDRSNGQYDIRLSKKPLDDDQWFLEGLPQTNQTDLQGFDINVPIQPFDGRNPVPARAITIRYMGPGSKRKDWYIRAQRLDTAYDLWRYPRGCPDVASANQVNAWVVVLRDVSGNFHARWLKGEDLGLLPKKVIDALEGPEVGVLRFDERPEDPAGPPADEFASRLLETLLSRHNVLLYGPPGTGKTYLMQQVARAFAAAHQGYYLDTNRERVPILARLEAHREFVTFHQSYSYEEFVVGLRPDPSSEKLVELVPRSGPLLELAEAARETGHASLLQIDEINRGNVSRIFGEFITLLEADKRLGDDGQETETTVRIRLPYLNTGRTKTANGLEIDNPYAMPRALFTLATMNSVDRSVAPLDSALRRRFHVVEMPPDLESVARLVGLPAGLPDSPVVPDPFTTRQEVVLLALCVLKRLNHGISVYLGGEMRLGQWYLASLLETESASEAATQLHDLWGRAIIPQLRELFQGRLDQLEELLGLEGAEGNAGVGGLRVVRPSDEQEARGADTWLDPYPDASEIDTLRFLRKLAGARTPPASAPQPPPAATP